MARSKQTSPVDEYQDVAHLVRQTRLSKKLTKQKVSQSIQLPVETITQLESRKSRDLPQSNIVGLYVRYGELLGIPRSEIIETIGTSAVVAKQEVFKKKPQKRSVKRNVILSRAALFSVVLVCVTGILAYGLWQLLILIDRPILKLEYPENNAYVRSSKLELRGEAPNDVTVLVNGEPVTVGEDHHFMVPLYLQPGYNQITVTAINNFSREETIQRTVFFEQN